MTRSSATVKRLQSRLIAAAKRYANTSPCVPGTFSSNCARCKAKAALDKAVAGMEGHK